MVTPTGLKHVLVVSKELCGAPKGLNWGAPGPSRQTGLAGLGKAVQPGGWDPGLRGRRQKELLLMWPFQPKPKDKASGITSLVKKKV